MKYNGLLALSLIFFGMNIVAHADIVDQDGILRDENGKIRYMYQPDAVKACADFNMRLPSIRDLLRQYEGDGIVIKEEDEVTREWRDSHEGNVVNAPFPNGDRFVYDNDKYKSPSGDLGHQCFWSTNRLVDYSYVFCAGYGKAVTLAWFDLATAVRCIKIPQADHKPGFLNIAKNADGSVMHMTQADAIKYCANKGAHLPSARELAKLSISLGAKGFVNACSSEHNCKSVKATNADGSSDNFNFYNDGYQRPAGDMGDNFFWSSSSDSYWISYRYLLRGSDGFIGFAPSLDSDPSGAVLCASGR